MIPTIRKSFVVNVPLQKAFDVFTQSIDLWWPRTHHIGKTPMIQMVLEPHVGGRWYTIHEDGTEMNAGRVLEWESPHRLMLAWQINANFEYDPTIISEVEIAFLSISPSQTSVEFEHRNLDRLGEGSKNIENMDAGWGMIMEQYARVADAGQKIKA